MSKDFSDRLESNFLFDVGRSLLSEPKGLSGRESPDDLPDDDLRGLPPGFPLKFFLGESPREGGAERRPVPLDVLRLAIGLLLI